LVSNILLRSGCDDPMPWFLLYGVESTDTDDDWWWLHVASRSRRDGSENRAPYRHVKKFFFPNLRNWDFATQLDEPKLRRLMAEHMASKRAAIRAENDARAAARATIEKANAAIRQHNQPIEDEIAQWHAKVDAHNAEVAAQYARLRSQLTWDRLAPLVAEHNKAVDEANRRIVQGERPTVLPKFPAPSP
jgi:hypothetical protein